MSATQELIAAALRLAALAERNTDDRDEWQHAIDSVREACARAMVQPAAPDGWQPIETAPTDGTRILLRGMGGKIADGHYGQPDGYANPKQFVWPYIHANPTHWRPLPAQHESAAPVELPEPDTHCYDTDEERDVWSHSPDQMRTYGDAREAAGYARGLEVASRRGA